MTVSGHSRGIAGINAVRQYILLASIPADTVSSPLPLNSYLEDLEVNLTAIAGGATEVLLSIWRDAAGTYSLVTEIPCIITLGGPAATGGVNLILNKTAKFSEDMSVRNVGSQDNVNLYVGAALDIGTATAEFLLNWRTL